MEKIKCNNYLPGVVMSLIGSAREADTTRRWSGALKDVTNAHKRSHATIGSSRESANFELSPIGEADANIVEIYKHVAINYVGVSKKQKNARYKGYTRNIEHNNVQKKNKMASIAAGAGVGLTVAGGVAAVSTVAGGGAGFLVAGPVGAAAGAGGGLGAGLTVGIPAGIAAGIVTTRVMKRSLITHSPHYQAWKAENAAEEIREAFYQFISGDEILGNEANGLLDPITFDILRIPVKAPDGLTYEYEGIIEYIEGQRNLGNTLESPFKKTLTQVQELELPDGVPPFEPLINGVEFSEDYLRFDHRKRAQIIARIIDIIEQQKTTILSQDETDQLVPNGPAFTFDKDKFSKKVLKNIADGLEALKLDLLEKHFKEKNELLNYIDGLLEDGKINTRRYNRLEKVLGDTFQLTYFELLERDSGGETQAIESSTNSHSYNEGQTTYTDSKFTETASEDDEPTLHPEDEMMESDIELSEDDSDDEAKYTELSENNSNDVNQQTTDVDTKSAENIS